ncbi:MAG: hypothetical protein R2754_17285 [Microthrixaceae bacterium]
MDEKFEIADRLGVADVFALRRVSEDQLVNLVGVGRGEGWAGNISIDPQREPLVAQALSTHELVRHSGESTRIFGPYWTEHAAIVMVGDFVVVLGGEGVADQDDATLIEAAGDLAWTAGEVSPEKRLADELEVTKAALSVASLRVTSLDGFLADLADAAIDALSCEFGAVVLSEPHPHLVLAPSGWRPAASDVEIRDSLVQLISQLDLERPVVAQDLSVDGLADSPLGFGEGLVSRCVVPLRGQHLRGAVVIAHTVECPRGFTSLCQQVAARIGDQASQVLSTTAEAGAPAFGA